MKTTIIRLFAAAALCALPTTANAAVTYTLIGGKLTGVSGVVIDKNTYDVAFVDGTCAGVFGACGSTPSFDFATRDDAYRAANVLAQSVLVSKVVIDGKSYNFDSQVGLVSGLGSRGGDVMVPYAVKDGQAQTVYVRSRWADPGTFSTTLDSGTDQYSVWAKFKLTASAAPDPVPVVSDPVASAVPEPATWAMMMLGFGIIGSAMRRREQRTTIRFA